jgi:hypothetical protein
MEEKTLEQALRDHDKRTAILAQISDIEFENMGLKIAGRITLTVKNTEFDQVQYEFATVEESAFWEGRKMPREAATIEFVQKLIDINKATIRDLQAQFLAI